MKRQDFKIEICANSVESCLAAMEGGADRVELCASMPEGGVSPSYGEIVVARRRLTSLRLHVMIRPRGGDFVYSKLELERMALDIDEAKELGADGVVFGCLHSDGTIDLAANRMLMEHVGNMSTTFHRAFDRCADAEDSLEKIIDLGFGRVLTSGQQPTADKGVALLAKLNQQANGRIILLAGSGVNETNIATIYRETMIHEFHFSARIRKPGRMKFMNPSVYMGLRNTDENAIDETSAEKVQRTIQNLLDAQKL